MAKKIIKYKLTDENMQTRNGFQWELGRWYEVDGRGRLCSEHWLHFYHHPLLAVLLNPIHADIKGKLRLFEAEVEGKTEDDNGLKCGYTKARLVKEVDVPEFTTNQKVAFAIYCALEIYREKSFVRWANNWLLNKDRTAKTAKAAVRAARAAWATEAAEAARAAVWATEAAEAAWAAWAARAAEAAVWADHKWSKKTLIRLTKKAYKFERRIDGKENGL